MPTYTYDHIHLRSLDPMETAQYFNKMFDAKIMESVQSDGQPRVDIDINGLIIFIAKAGEDTPPSLKEPHFGLDHFGFRVENLDEAVKELKERGAEFAVISGHGDVSCEGGGDAEYGFEDLCASCADEARDAEDLAIMQVERNAVRIGGGGMAQVLQGQRHAAAAVQLTRRGHLRGQLATDHRTDKLFGRGVGNVGSHHRLAVAQHGDAVAIGEDLA